MTFALLGTGTRSDARGSGPRSCSASKRASRRLNGTGDRAHRRRGDPSCAAPPISLRRLLRDAQQRRHPRPGRLARPKRSGRLEGTRGVGEAIASFHSGFASAAAQPPLPGRLMPAPDRGIDPGPPEGVSNAEWDRRLAAARQRMQSFVAAGVESADRGELVEGSEARSRLRKKQQSRRRRKAG